MGPQATCCAARPAPGSAATCPQTGTLTGAWLGYGNENRLTYWQSDQSGNPNATARFLYDGAGQCVHQATATGSTTATTAYVAGG
jgi:hypothetical protein